MYVYTQAQRWLLGSMLETLRDLRVISHRTELIALRCVYEFRS
jgi:hypothetical protein